MTGFEYVAAVGMIYEGERERGSSASGTSGPGTTAAPQPVRRAECATTTREPWQLGAVLALTGFHFSAVEAASRSGHGRAGHSGRAGTRGLVLGRAITRGLPCPARRREARSS